MFSRSEVIVLTNIQRQTNPQTNKQTPLKTSDVLCYATTSVKNSINDKCVQYVITVQVSDKNKSVVKTSRQ